jgi:hypothetical protein
MLITQQVLLKVIRENHAIATRWPSHPEECANQIALYAHDRDLFIREMNLATARIPHNALEALLLSAEVNPIIGTTIGLS